MLKQTPSVASDGSKVTASDVNTSSLAFVIDSSFLIQPSGLCDTKPFLIVSFFQYNHHHFLLPCSLHLFPGPGQRLVREPGPVFTLEREEEAELPQLRGRGVLRPSPRS